MRRLAVLAMVLAACSETDLGAPCHLLAADNTEQQPRPGHSIVQSGSGECSEFVCASFDGAPPVCSRPCENDDACAEPWKCRAALLSPESLEELRARTEGHDENGDGTDDFQALAAGLSDARYCGPSTTR